VTDGISRGSRRDRLLSKFVESEYEKIDRLVELYVRWFSLSLFYFWYITCAGPFTWYRGKVQLHSSSLLKKLETMFCA